MQLSLKTLIVSLLPLAASQDSAPAKSGYSIVFSDNFVGTAGSAPSTTNWQRQTAYPNSNWNEVQHYTANTANARLSGSTSTLQIIPLKSSTGEWSSARLHSNSAFTCPVGKKMLIEARIRVGNNDAASQQGIWPAFWALGNSFRAAKNPVAWPACGEWDIMEGKNGVANNFGTLHCDTAPGGRCNEYVGLGAQIGYTKGKWHTWAFEVDRTETVYANWPKQSMSWSLDGVKYKTVTGADVGSLDVWTSVARSPFFMVFNVAVGGDFPGQPNAQTLGGLESGMEVAYVAVYNSA